MKLLFTCIGRRVELVQAFRQAGKNLNVDLEIFATDSSNTAPALAFCDKTFIAPPIKSDKYLSFLLQVCKSEGVDGLVPTIDTDLLLLAKNKSLFSSIGTTVFVANPDKVLLCRDKRLTSDYFNSLGLGAPKAVACIDEYQGGFPAFIKPKDGSSSINAFRANNMDELRSYADKMGEYVIQPFVDGTEYTVDVFCDRNGAPIYITPRIRLAVRAGEVLKTEIRQDDGIIDEIKKLVSDFCPCGGITVQLIKDNKTGQNMYIEINPRFGGGAPLSIKAGANAAEALIKVLNGEAQSFCNHAAEDGAIYSRFDQSVRVR